ncbi:MAG TPA: transposase [Kofleriaceae bacterium]|nr:transposase [Kofleriaceae bacterium]
MSGWSGTATLMATKVNKRGGRRAGAGRKRSIENWHDPKHVTREKLAPKHPVHAMLRTCEDVPRLRQRSVYGVFRLVLARLIARRKRDFRVVHISLQQSHVHLIVEAANESALSRGMQGFAISAAKAINKAFGRKGKVFKHRYKAKYIRTRDYARNALAYVLNNWRRHNEDHFDINEWSSLLDRYSSAISFEGWKGRPRWRIPAGYEVLPVSPPRTSLLRSDWRWHGLIDPREQPGPAG